MRGRENVMATQILQYLASLALAGVIGELQPADLNVIRTSAGVRASDAKIENLIREGCSKSATFLGLFRELQSSDWVVFVQSGSCPIPGIRGCLLHRVGTFQHQRYLRIIITRTAPSDAEAIGTIGHELQHAVEVVRHRQVTDASSIRDLYRRIGYVTKRTQMGEIYETAAALRAGAAVLEQLRARRPKEHGTAISGREGCGQMSALGCDRSLDFGRQPEQRTALPQRVKKTSTLGGTLVRNCSTPR